MYWAGKTCFPRAKAPARLPGFQGRDSRVNQPPCYSPAWRGKLHILSFFIWIQRICTTCRSRADHGTRRLLRVLDIGASSQCETHTCRINQLGLLLTGRTEGIFWQPPLSSYTRYIAKLVHTVVHGSKFLNVSISRHLQYLSRESVSPCWHTCRNVVHLYFHHNPR
jgi:hypothetical protein